MFLGKDGSKRNKDAAVIGYDLGERTAQISFWLPEREKPETVSLVTGEEQFSIPAILARCAERDVWLYGREAERSIAKGEGILVENLLSRAVSDQTVQVGEESYEAEKLLSLFIRRSLSLLTAIVKPEKIGACMFTVETVDKRTVETVIRAASMAGLKADRLSVLGRSESFYYYNIHQAEELWRHEVLLCDFTGSCLRTLLLDTNRHTTPRTVLVDEAVHEELGRPARTEDGAVPEETAKEMDARFTGIVKEVCGERLIDTVYLIGDGFGGEWYRNTLPMLCRGRRVFLGNNLYSKGACYAARQKFFQQQKGSATSAGTAVKGSPSVANYVFLGRDMLKANVGMEVKRCGEDSYLALLDAGVNWYDAQNECDFLLDADHSFMIRITPLTGQKPTEVEVTLDGVPARPDRTTRIHMTVSQPDEVTVKLTMEDMGFGELFPATHKIWEEIFLIDDKEVVV